MRVIVVDDSLIVREGLRRLLEAQGHRVVGTIAHPRHVADTVAAARPDAVILDIRMPPTFSDEGLLLAISLRTTMPDLGILVLSQHAVPEYASRLLESGSNGTGYLLKDRIFDAQQLTQTLQRLAAGGTAIDPDVVGELLTARRGEHPLDELSDRELDVLRLMAEGLTDKRIAERLFLSPHTVNTHTRHVFHKLGLPGRHVGNRRVLAVLAFLQARGR
ncbi:response regulator transcription factor [Streptomyces sp. NPDC086554]|uniref:response regulator transcription factor n=1 Tax=Streptomyces sp. NPDC086554 TaxID=3154864 RepID=UPI0034210B2D